MSRFEPGSLMPVHFAYSAEQGLRVYDSVELVYCEARISNLRDVQLRLLLGVPVTFGGVVIDCPAQRARFGVMAAQGVLDGLA